jgi:uncharacterized protein
MEWKKYNIIDCHTHFFPFEIFRRVVQGMGEKAVEGFSGSVEDYLSFLRRDGISKAITLNFLPTPQMKERSLRELPAGLPDYRQAEAEIEAKIIERIIRNNLWACNIGKEHPEIIPFISVDPMMSPEQIREEITDKVRHHGAGGLKLNPGMCRYFAHDRRLWPAYAAAQELDLPVMAQSYMVDKKAPQYSEPKYYGDVLAAFPKLRLVLTHAGLPFWEQVRALARQYSGVCFDISLVLDPEQEGSLSDAEFISLFREIGMERAIYGSSFPWHERAPVLERIVRMDLTESEKQLLLGENARRVYKI